MQLVWWQLVVAMEQNFGLLLSLFVHIRVYTVVDSKWLERNESMYLIVTLFVASHAEADKP